MSPNPYQSPQAEPEPVEPVKQKGRVTVFEIVVLLFGIVVAGVTLLLLFTGIGR